MSNQDFNQLINKVVDGTIDDDGWCLLIEALRSDEKVREKYVEVMRLECAIRRWSTSLYPAHEEQLDIADLIKDIIETPYEYSPSNTENLNNEQTPSRNTANATTDKKASWRNRNVQLCLAASFLFVCLTVGVFLAFPIQGGNNLNDQRQANAGSERVKAESEIVVPIKHEEVVARVLGVDDAVKWTLGKEPDDFLLRLKAGDTIGIDEGEVRIEFVEGAFLVLRSNSLLKITSGTSATLFEGSVVGRASNGNFNLQTPAAQVVDVGTAFGVSIAEDGSTDVSVYEGEVHVHGQLKSSDVSDSYEVLLEGMELRVNRLGEVTHRNRFDPDNDILTPKHGQITSVSLVELLGGDTVGGGVTAAASIDPRRGHWGEPPWLKNKNNSTRFGDTQYTRTTWNRMVDGVFIPRSNAREMQIDSDGHVVFLPENSGATWGAIWGRRRLSDDLTIRAEEAAKLDRWGNGSLWPVLEKLRSSTSAMMGLHANAGITFDLDVVRSDVSYSLEAFRGAAALLADIDTPGAPNRVADLHVFVDGKLRYSRLEFSNTDGDREFDIPLKDSDRYLTLVVTDGDGDHAFDQVVLVDPELTFSE